MQAQSVFCALLALTFSLGVTGCGADSGMTTVSSKNEVEIAPGKWLELSAESTVHASDLKPQTKNPHQLINTANK